VSEEMGGGHMVAQHRATRWNKAMSLLLNAEGHCMDVALYAKEVQEVHDYLEAADLLDQLWRGLFRAEVVATAPPGGHDDHKQL